MMKVAIYNNSNDVRCNLANTSEREKYVCFAVIIPSGFPLRVLLQLIGQPFASPCVVCCKTCVLR